MATEESVFEAIRAIPLKRCSRCGLPMGGSECFACEPSVVAERLGSNQGRRRKRRKHWHKVKPWRYESALTQELVRTAAPIMFKKAGWYLDAHVKGSGKSAERIAALLVQTALARALDKLGRKEFTEEEVLAAFNNLVEIGLTGFIDLEMEPEFRTVIDSRGLLKIYKVTRPRKGRWTFCKRCGYPRYRRASYLRRPGRGQYCSIACGRLNALGL